ncbi:glycosyltransferase [Aestuariivirga litoralis]|nr:glycosyltransferase [Aestuariivirga litoralis]
MARHFAVEYAVQFRLILPALARYRMPLPLGGTSNHFRSFVLRDIGGWDPFNVTEDADIGLRLARLGYRTSVLHSITYEEANIRLGNWLAQRARWLKGFMQTWLVHMRSPRRLLREFGWMGFLAVQSTLFGVALSALVHPVFVAIMIWQISQGNFLHPGLISPWRELSYFYLGTLGLSYGLMMTCGAAASRGIRLSGRVFVIATMPFYFLLTSVAGWMALWQLIRNPYHWNKTRHGLSRMAPMQMSRVPLIRSQRISS